MTIKRGFQATWISGIVLLLAAHANAGTISYTTNASGTEFTGTTNGASNSLVLTSTAGVAATLTFTPNTSSASGTPSNIDLGDFLLTCSTCTTAQTTTFSSFTFDLVVTDSTDGATGEFVGTSPGGTVSSNSSTVQVNWQAPLVIGPGGTNVLTGNFGLTSFDLVSPTSLIVAPQSGTPPGDTTVQGQINSGTPEPATFALVGGALFGLGLLGRKKALRR